MGVTACDAGGCPEVSGGFACVEQEDEGSCWTYAVLKYLDPAGGGLPNERKKQEARRCARHEKQQKTTQEASCRSVCWKDVGCCQSVSSLMRCWLRSSHHWEKKGIAPSPFGQRWSEHTSTTSYLLGLLLVLRNYDWRSTCQIIGAFARLTACKGTTTKE
jgi:hypothetical protein